MTNQKQKSAAATGSGNAGAKSAGGVVMRTACERCRSRRVKCSGTQPCDSCRNSGRECVFLCRSVMGRPRKQRQHPNAAVKAGTEGAGAGLGYPAMSSTRASCHHPRQSIESSPPNANKQNHIASTSTVWQPAVATGRGHPTPAAASTNIVNQPFPEAHTIPVELQLPQLSHAFTHPESAASGCSEVSEGFRQFSVKDRSIAAVMRLWMSDYEISRCLNILRAEGPEGSLRWFRNIANLLLPEIQDTSGNCHSESIRAVFANVFQMDATNNCSINATHVASVVAVQQLHSRPALAWCALSLLANQRSFPSKNSPPFQEAADVVRLALHIASHAESKLLQENRGEQHHVADHHNPLKYSQTSTLPQLSFLEAEIMGAHVQIHNIFQAGPHRQRALSLMQFCNAISRFDVFILVSLACIAHGASRSMIELRRAGRDQNGFIRLLDRQGLFLPCFVPFTNECFGQLDSIPFTGQEDGLNNDYNQWYRSQLSSWLDHVKSLIAKEANANRRAWLTFAWEACCLVLLLCEEYALDSTCVKRNLCLSDALAKRQQLAAMQSNANSRTKSALRQARTPVSMGRMVHSSHSSSPVGTEKLSLTDAQANHLESETPQNVHDVNEQPHTPYALLGMQYAVHFVEQLCGSTETPSLHSYSQACSSFQEPFGTGLSSFAPNSSNFDLNLTVAAHSAPAQAKEQHFGTWQATGLCEPSINQPHSQSQCYIPLTSTNCLGYQSTGFIGDGTKESNVNFQLPGASNHSQNELCLPDLAIDFLPWNSEPSFL